MITAMEAWQYTALRSSFKHHHEKLFLLPLLDPKGWARRSGYAAFNIYDPYGGPSSAFKECFDRVSLCLKSLFATV